MKTPFTLQQQQRDSSSLSSISTACSNDTFSFAATSAASIPTEKRHKRIIAARTSICSKQFDRCELQFRQDHIQLKIWKDIQLQWQGHVMYVHMRRFCFSQIDHPPYILLLQLDNERGSKSDFAGFYDPIFAKVCQENDTKEEESTISIYGVVFFFDEVMDYMRCQSMADSYPMLADLFSEKLAESEVRQYTRLDELRMSRYLHRDGTKESSFCDARHHSFAEVMGKGAKQALGSVTSFFRPTARSSVLEEDSSLSDVEEHDNTKQSRTLKLSEKLKCGSRAESGEQTLTILRTPREQSGIVRATDATTFSVVPQNEKHSENAKPKKGASFSWLDNERVKRRRIESRRNEGLLEYPYDGSDNLGRISLTLGDVDRLVPGEFLNDNIIDFYLRFLWRHLDSLQQQQMYFFTSHFFSQLNGTNGTYELSTANPDERFTRVARWTHKETNLFDKRFLFIPINDSFHWSLAVFCNPGSAVIKKHRKVRRRVNTDACNLDPRKVVDLVDSHGSSIGGDRSSFALACHGSCVDEEVEEEELKSCQEDRVAHPPCILFLDSLRCHRKKKFVKMLRNYLECEYKVRFASSSAGSMSEAKSAIGGNGLSEEKTVITVFDSDGIGLVEPNIPLQSNSSDCGVFLLMYAVSIVRLFPFGVTREDLESNLASMLSPHMFSDEHVLEFREYLQQLIFCLQFLEKHGLPEQNVRDEGLECFAID
ncbi:unnamed protein product [Peronospora belbahrii]|uniref:Ubiquitin-like protease family profile domain-containing protein n=1 Tax=Peronospora belbahrii TaxID=622444 RepID=A0ABN8CQU2_9STRA|nr:unnamed protein product [Peronospora belbahrii]